MKSKIFKKNNVLTFLSICLLVGFVTYVNCGSESIQGAKFEQSENTGDNGKVPGDNGNECVPNSQEADPSAFISVWETTQDDESITLALREGFDYDFTVDWGDCSEVQTIQTWNDPAITHTYAQAGQYTVTLKGLAQAWYFNNDGKSFYTAFTGNADKILQVTQFGDMGWINLYAAFAGCDQLTTFEGGDVHLVSDISYMFMKSPLVTPNLSSWNTENMTKMSYVFAETSAANPDVSNWNTQNVTDMRAMFYYATSANPDVSNWNTQNVTTMENIFYLASTANPDVSNWSTQNVTSMRGIFSNASTANPDVSNWNTQNVTDMSGAFDSAFSANPDVSNWDTQNVTNMSHMFNHAFSANPDVSNWNTQNVTIMTYMFNTASTANPDVSNWNTQNVMSMDAMFYSASSANPDVSGWNTQNVMNMSQMFQNASAANPDMSNWNFENVTNMENTFSGASAFSVQNYSNMLNQIAATTTKTDVSLGAQQSEFFQSASASRSFLINTKNWIIQDNGLAY